MPFDEGLAQRIRETLDHRRGISEKRMFGGLCFMLNGNMVAGVVAHELMVRVGVDAYEDALSKKHAREMDFTGKPLRGMVYVAEKGFQEDEDLERWIDRGMSFAKTLPRK